MKIIDIPSGAVVVGVDGSSHSDHALDWAARHASHVARPLILLNATGSMTMPVGWMTQAGAAPESYPAEATVFSTAVLDAARARVASQHPALDVRTIISQLDARTALLGASDAASMVVVGSRGRGPVASLLLGSVSAAVARHAVSAVTVVRPQNPGLVRNGVLVAIDGSEKSLPILEFAFRQASELDLPLSVVHAVFDVAPTGVGSAVVGPTELGFETATLALSQSLAGFTEKFPDVHVDRDVIRGAVVSNLLLRADKMDLVVLGHHHGGTLDRIVFGSTAINVLEHAATTVTVVPQT